MAPGVDITSCAVSRASNLRIRSPTRFVETENVICVRFSWNWPILWCCPKLTQLCSIRLSEHFFTENLLDRTLFLEWYLSYLETCSVDMLPAAYLISGIYWRDLLNTRRLGRRLAEVLLGKGEAVRFSQPPECVGINLVSCADLIRRRQGRIRTTNAETFVFINCKTPPESSGLKDLVNLITSGVRTFCFGIGNH